MKNISRHVGKLEILERLKNSTNGNPRYRCYVAGVHFVTKADCSYSYSLPNYQDKEAVVTVGIHYGKATLDTIELTE